MRQRAIAACTLGLVAVLGSGHAAAQVVAARAAAEALFRDARQLKQQGKLAEACDKFAESQRIEPGLGTLLNLASCHEELGKTASAWAEFTEAASVAMNTGQKRRAELARRHAAQLERRLSLVAFRAAVLPDGLRIKIGDKELAAATIGSQVPFDPGVYAIEVAAPHKQSWSTEITVTTGPATLEVAIPELMTVAAAPRPLPPKPPEAPALPLPGDSGDGFGARRVLGLAIGGVGLIGLGVGGYFGVRTFDRQSVVEDHCRGRLCDAQGLDADRDAHTSATVSTIAIAAGAALTAGGLVLVLLPEPPASAGAGGLTRRGGWAVSMISDVGRAGPGIQVEGTW